MVYDAIILAGNKRGAKNIFNKNKVLLEVKGIPSFIRVLSTLQKIECIGEIRIVGPEEEIESLLKKFSRVWRGPKTIKAVPQQDNIIDNVWKTFLDMLPNYKEGMEASPEQKEKAIIVVPGDIPLITPNEINEFISKCDLIHFDYCLGVVSDKTLSYYSPKKGNKGIRMPILPLKERNYRINNLHMLRPFKVANRYRLQEMYELRYQRELRNIWKLFIKLIRLKEVKSVVMLYILIQGVLLFRKIGMAFISKKIICYLTLNKLLGHVSRILGTKMAIAETSYGGAALDIDNKSDYGIINEKFEEWMEYQNDLSNDRQKPSFNPSCK